MVEVHRQNNVTLVKLDAEYDALDQAHFDQASDTLLAQAQKAEPPLIVVDVSQTAYMGSAFLEVLFRSWKRTRQRGGRLVLCGVQPFCAEVMSATRLDTMFEIFPSVDVALAALAAA